jgi:hypothetical protein
MGGCLSILVGLLLVIWFATFDNLLLILQEIGWVKIRLFIGVSFLISLIVSLIVYGESK